MADITSIVPADVRPFDAHLCTMVPLVAASAVICGDAVCLDSAGKIAKADADVVATAQAIGIVVAIAGTDQTTAAAGDMCDVVVYGPVYLGSATTLTIGSGTRLYVSATAGLMDQTVIATAGDFPFIVGFAYAANVVWVNPQTAIPVVVAG